MSDQTLSIKTNYCMYFTIPYNPLFKPLQMIKISKLRREDNEFTFFEIFLVNRIFKSINIKLLLQNFLTTTKMKKLINRYLYLLKLIELSFIFLKIGYIMLSIIILNIILFIISFCKASKKNKRAC